MSLLRKLLVENSVKPSVITYTTTDGNIITPTTNTFFDRSNNHVNIVSNIYENGQGMMIFDNSITTIGSFAFRGIDNLLSLELPDSILFNDGQYTFCECSNLQYVKLPSKMRSLGLGAFEACFNLKELIMPDSLNELGGFVCSRCYNMEKIKISPNINVLYAQSFYSVYKITEIELSTNLKKLDTSAFASCRALATIRVHAITPPEIFDGMNKYAFFADTPIESIYVPSESIELYKNADYWKEFSDKIKSMPSG